MSDTNGTTPAPSSATPEHPKWCTAHGDDWHQSADISLAHHDVLLSDGTLDGSLKVFIYETEPCDHSISLDEAEALGRALLRLVEEARA